MNQAARFPLGTLYATPGVIEAVPHFEVMLALARHVRGDWGEVCDEDRAENDFAVDKHLRILSAYTAENGTRFWIITEADRSSTTLLLPDEY
ncbi:MAG: hypothetical protein QM770_01125 [Tepidisphaeraceae bacterium]